MESRPVEKSLPVEMVCVASRSQRMHPDDLQRMKQTISWELEPEFPQMGRSAWIRLAHPFEAQSGSETQVIKSLKLKGVGLRDHRGGTHRPSNSAYRRPDAHLGFDQDGGFCELWSPPSPMGGLSLSRAIVEYATANELCAAGPIAEVPLFLYRYPGMAGFRDDSGSVSDLAVMVAGLPSDTPARADHLVHYARQEEPVQAVLRDWTRDHVGDREFDWSQAQLTVWRDYGKRLREFHNCGFYRHNSHPCNIGLGPRGVFFVDLDSTRHLLECSPRLRALQVLRDAGAIFNIIDYAIRSAGIRFGRQRVRDQRPGGRSVLELLLSRRSAPGVRGGEGGGECDVIRLMGHVVLRHRGDQRRAGSGRAWYREFMAQRHSQRGRGVDGPALFSRLMPGLATPYSESRLAYQGASLSRPKSVWRPSYFSANDRAARSTTVSRRLQRIAVNRWPGRLELGLKPGGQN